MIARGFHRQADRRREGRLELPRLAWAQADGAQAEGLAQRKLALELAGLVPVAGDRQGPARAQPDLHAADPLELRREVGPQRSRREPQLERRLASTPNSTSATGASIPAATWEAPLPIRSRSRTTTDMPSLRTTPGDREPDHAAPDNRQIGVLEAVCRHAADATRRLVRASRLMPRPGPYTLGRMEIAAELGAERRARLDQARLYLVCDSSPAGRRAEGVLRAAIAGGRRDRAAAGQGPGRRAADGRRTWGPRALRAPGSAPDRQ